MAMLYPDRLANTPHWFVPDPLTGDMVPASLEEMADPYDKYAQASRRRAIAGQLIVDYSDDQPGWGWGYRHDRMFHAV